MDGIPEPYVRLFWGAGFPFFPYISRIHIAHRGEDEPSILGTTEIFGDPAKRSALKSS